MVPQAVPVFGQTVPDSIAAEGVPAVPGALVREYPKSPIPVFALAVTRDGRLAVAGSWDGRRNSAKTADDLSRLPPTQRDAGGSCFTATAASISWPRHGLAGLRPDWNYPSRALNGSRNVSWRPSWRNVTRSS